jgi:hypothetical protein
LPKSFISLRIEFIKISQDAVNSIAQQQAAISSIAQQQAVVTSIAQQHAAVSSFLPPQLSHMHPPVNMPSPLHLPGELFCKMKF